MSWESQSPLLSESLMASLSIFARLLTGFWLILVHLTLTSAFTCPPKDAFDWESVSFTSAYVKDTLTPCAPCKDIQWTPCYNAMFCARLKVQCSSIIPLRISFIPQVPLDYENPQGDELAIALLKVPAHISTSDPAYRGSVLINPGGFGGPGGSGVDMALQLGPTIQTVIGPEFDIIGFDPRGKRSAFIVPDRCLLYIQESVGQHQESTHLEARTCKNNYYKYAIWMSQQWTIRTRLSHGLLLLISLSIGLSPIKQPG